MDLHHGKIRVFSEGEGTGCTFTVDLPMTRKIEQSNAPKRISAMGRVIGLVGRMSGSIKGSNGSKQVPLSSATFLSPRAHGENNQAGVNNSRLSINRSHSSPVVVSNEIIPMPKSKSDKCSAMSVGRQSLRDLAEHDKMATIAQGRQSEGKATASTKQLSGLIMSPSSFPPRGKHAHTRDATAAVVVLGSEELGHDAADPPSQQQLRPATTTMVTTSSPSRAPAATPLSSSAVVAAVPSLSAPSPSPKSPKVQPPPGLIYHILVVDDSTMTRKMMMKTLRNGGDQTDKQNTLQHILSLHLCCL